MRSAEPWLHHVIEAVSWLGGWTRNRKGSHGFEQIGLAFPVEDVGRGDAAAVGVQTVEQSGRHHDVGWSPASARQLTEALAVIIFSRRLENPSF